MLILQRIHQKVICNITNQNGFFKANTSPKSPYGRRDKLEDSLTKFFTPNPNKRRLHKEGEYWQLSRGNAVKSPNEDDGQIKNEVIDMDQVSNAEKQETFSTSSHEQTQLQMQRKHKPPKQPKLGRKDNAAAIKSAQIIRRAYKGKWSMD